MIRVPFDDRTRKQEMLIFETMLRKEILEKIKELLFERTGTRYAIQELFPVKGGSINEAYQILTDKGSFFLKLNDAEMFPGMFDAEEKGLALLRKLSAFKVPEVYACARLDGDAFLLMEYISSAAADEEFFLRFGQLLGQMHRNTAKTYGLDHDNFIGSLPQSNRQHVSWIGFFTEERMEKQLRLAVDSGLLKLALLKNADRFYRRLQDLMPAEQPALIHGDLWSGNYLPLVESGVCLIDPAVYYGHREMDIAMSKLFGGFSAGFYASYNEHYPLEKGWENRIAIFQLYPLLVHVNLFGGSYIRDVSSILERF